MEEKAIITTIILNVITLSITYIFNVMMRRGQEKLQEVKKSVDNNASQIKELQIKMAQLEKDTLLAEQRNKMLEREIGMIGGNILGELKSMEKFFNLKFENIETFFKKLERKYDEKT